MENTNLKIVSISYGQGSIDVKEIDNTSNIDLLDKPLIKEEICTDNLKTEPSFNDYDDIKVEEYSYYSNNSFLSLNDDAEPNSSSSESSTNADEKCILENQLESVIYEGRITSPEPSEKPYKCIVCPRAYDSKPDLNDHLHAAHSRSQIRKQKIIAKRKFECDICKKCFSKETVLQVHTKRHFADQGYECDICKRTFIKRINLEKHKKRHTKENISKCEICHEIFFLKKDYYRHMIVHGDKSFKCDLCGKFFLRKHNLETHLARHVGEKLNECNRCGKSFVLKDYLRKHEFTPW